MNRNVLYFFSWFLGVFLFDLCTKWWATSVLWKGKTIPIVADVVQLEWIQNDGVAFGIDVPFLWLLTIILIVALVIVYIRSFSETHPQWHHIGFWLLLGGAIGNAWERIFVGEVVDFVSVRWFSVFNIADVGICLGVVMLLWVNVRGGDKEVRRKTKGGRRKE